MTDTEPRVTSQDPREPRSQKTVELAMIAITASGMLLCLVAQAWLVCRCFDVALALAPAPAPGIVNKMIKLPELADETIRPAEQAGLMPASLGLNLATQMRTLLRTKNTLLEINLKETTHGETVC